MGVWLIEVNSSPAMDYSTQVTTPLVKKVMEDTAKILVDRREDPLADIGEWELLRHDGERQCVHRPVLSGKLEVIGKPIQPSKLKRKKKKRKSKQTGTKGTNAAGTQAQVEDTVLNEAYDALESAEVAVHESEDSDHGSERDCGSDHSSE